MYYVVNKLKPSKPFGGLGEIFTKTWINLRKEQVSDEFLNNLIDSMEN